MVEVLHTADVHLSVDAPERMDALEAVIDLAESLEVKILTIGGDLFHDTEAVEEFRPRLRNDLFANREFEVVVIPGNHDTEGFRGNTFFGEQCTAIIDEPFGHVEFPDLDCRITGVPFVSRPDEEFFVALNDRESFDGTEILLVHCTLDVGFSREVMGDESERLYFPVTPDELSALSFDFILGGHFHQPRKESLAAGVFAYPGSPASTRRGETERRQVVTVDFATRDLGFVGLDTFHYAKKRFEVLPGEEQTVCTEIEEWVAASDGPGAFPIIEVEGFHGLDEKEFRQELLAAAEPVEHVHDETLTAARIEAHPLYRDFEAILEEQEWEQETKQAVRRRTLEVFNDVREVL